MDSKARFERFASTAHVRDGLRLKSVRGALFVAGSSGIDFALRLVSAVVLARLLIPEHFGLIGMVTAVTGIAEQISALGLSTATVQAPGITHQQCSNLFWINFFVGIAFAAVLAAFSPLVAAFYKEPRLVPITLAISTNFIWGGLKFQHEALLDRQMKLAQISGNRLVAGFLSTAVAIALALVGVNYWALVAREILRGFFVLVGLWILSRWVPGAPRRGVDMRRLLIFGRDMTLAQIVTEIVSRVDGLLVGRFAGATALGLYRQAYNLMMAPMEQLNGPIISVAQPGLSALQVDPGRYVRYYRQILFLVSLVTMPVGMFSIIYGEELVLALLGPRWTQAAIFLQIFGLLAMFTPTVATSGLVLVTRGKSQRLLVVSLLHSLVLGGLMVLGVHWGAKGIAAARVAAGVLLMVPKLLYSFAGTPVHAADFFKEVSRPFLASLVMAAALLGFRSLFRLDSELIKVLSGFGIGFLAYFGCLALLPESLKKLRSLGKVFREAFRKQSAGWKASNPAGGPF